MSKQILVSLTLVVWLLGSPGLVPGLRAGPQAPPPLKVLRNLYVQLQNLPEGWKLDKHSRRPTLRLKRPCLRDGRKTDLLGREGFPESHQDVMGFFTEAHNLEIELEMRSLQAEARDGEELQTLWAKRTDNQKKKLRALVQAARPMSADAFPSPFLFHHEAARGKGHLRWFVPGPTPGAEAQERRETVPLEQATFTLVIPTRQYNRGKSQHFLQVVAWTQFQRREYKLEEVQEVIGELLAGLTFSGGENASLRFQDDPGNPLHFWVELRSLHSGGPGTIPPGSELVLRVWDTDQNTQKLQDHLLLDGERVEASKYRKAPPPPPPPRRAEPADLYTIPEPSEVGVAGESRRLKHPTMRLEDVVENLSKLQEISLPVPLTKWRHEVQLLLDFNRLALFEIPGFVRAGRGLPCPEDPTEITVRAELRGPPDSRGKRKVLARAKREVSIDHVARVQWVGFQTADAKLYQVYNGGNRQVPVERGDLSDYVRRHQDSLGEQRILVDRRATDPKFGTIRTPGTPHGLPLRTGDLLRAGDRVTLNPEKMASHGHSGIQRPTLLKPAQLELSLRYLDGAKGKLIVTEDCGLYTVTIGATATGTGFVPAQIRLAYFAENYLKEKLQEKVVLWTLEFMFPPLGGVLDAYDTAGDFMDVTNWVFGARPQFLPGANRGGR